MPNSIEFTDITSPLLTAEEVAELLKVPVSWVYERTRKRAVDRIPGFRLGKYWRFREADVLAWIERQRLEGTGQCLTLRVQSLTTQIEADEPAERKQWLDRDIRMAV